MSDQIMVEQIEETIVDAEKPRKKRDGDSLIAEKRLEAVREALNMLIAAVDVDNDEIDEYDVLARLAVSAGLMWRCVNPQCRGINHNNCGGCDNCGKHRPRKREEPKPDQWA